MKNKDKNYDLGNNQSVTLKPLTFGQVKQITKLYTTLEISADTTIAGMVEMIMDQKAEEFLAILFPDCEVNWDEVEADTLVEIYEDFLSGNPKTIETLKSLSAPLQQAAASMLASQTQ